MEAEAVEGIDNRKDNNWTTRATRKPKSVVQTLFNRQLGLPHFSRDGDVTPCVTLRQMFESRTPSYESGKPTKAARVDLKPGKNLYTGGNRGTWTQIFVPDKTEISVIDSKLWARWKVRHPGQIGNGIEKAIEAFYLVEPSPIHGLKCMHKVHSAGNGKMKHKFTFGSKSLSNEETTTYFLTLIEPGILRAYNLVKKEIIQDLKLPLDISPGIKGYTDISIFDSNKKIFLMGTQKKLTKVIILLNYPPWREIGILHVEIPVKISIQDGVCFLLKENEKCLEITAWTLLHKQVDKNPPIPSPGRVIIDDPNPEKRVMCASERRLRRFPTILSKVDLQMAYFGLIEMDIPLFFGAVKHGIDFFNFYPDPPPVYEFVGTDEEEPISVFPFPSGGTCKVLICSHFSGQSQTLEFKPEWNGRKSQKSLTVTPLQCFNHWEKLRANPRPAVTAPVGERRPRRSCVNNNKINDEQSSKLPILGIAYCSLMDYLAVLTADEEEFQVAIYDTLTLQVVKALPPVFAWPRMKGSNDANPKRSSIENVEFDFEAEFIFVSFQYSAGCKTQREVFYTRLLSENF